ncbi:hypothetical protein [Legionella jamestowniensis]|uniref:DNA polymerase V, subunit C n=1 Tax=Legionella jamestowniensis TaxID=455 RepID=A0A0W0UN24_9GAMM|nr:hypothetical protein [Legionella jamestowniensis]KTD09278.1 DNA polymerase V, subunit C [Legionella jamestowniensis]OCH99126.1 hypothetical protein A8135_07665 [Legionella jamestowniensis]
MSPTKKSTGFPIDIWGVGRQWTKKLMGFGVTNALELSKLNPRFVKDRFNVVLQRTVLDNGQALS